MNYVTFGQKKKPAIVFLHGWGGSIDSWISIAKRFAGFGFYSVVLDFWGFGSSPEPKEPIGLEEYAVGVEAIINDLGLEKVSIVGHSFGGRVAIMLASRNKIDVWRLVLVDSAGVKPRRGIVYQYKVWRYKRLKIKVKKGLVDSSILDSYGSSDYKLLSPVMKQIFIRVVNLDLICYAKGIKAETLLIWGRKDKDTPLYMARKFKRAIKNSRLVVYPAGHYSYLDCMDEFVDELYTFLIY